MHTDDIDQMLRSAASDLVCSLHNYLHPPPPPLFWGEGVLGGGEVTQLKMG